MIIKVGRRVIQGLRMLRHHGWRHTMIKLFAFLYHRFDQMPLLDEAVEEIPMSLLRDYQYWLFQNHPRRADLKRLEQTIELFDYKPTFSVIVPVYNTPELLLREMIESVQFQIYPHWELCLADDASSEPHVRSILEEYAANDSRIRVVFRKDNGHISASSNSALEVATGEFIALLDHDDLLTHDALYEMALKLNRDSSIDMMYSDEDKIDEYGRCYDPFFKPDWSPESFLSRMYTSHFSVYRHSIIKDIGGFRLGFEGSQDYDLVLRFTEKTDRIVHIPRILYHWRAHEDSTASDLDNKTYAIDAATKGLSEAIERRNEPGKVLPNGFGHFIVRYEIQEPAPVSIIIPTRDLSGMLGRCLDSVFEKSTYPHFQVTILDNGSVEESTLALFDSWKAKEPQRFQVVRHDVPFNFSTINNHAVTHTDAPYLLFLNNDIEVITPDWLEAMIEQAQRPAIGAVGAMLLYPDDTVQHAGVIGGVGGVAGHSHKMLPATVPGYFDQLQTVNNYSAVTAACLMCRRSVFEEIQGFEEELAYSFNDIDFCFKMIAKGYRNVYLPHVQLYHYESKSRGYEDTPAKQQRFAKEIRYMKNKWPALISQDPYYNPNLSLISEVYELRMSYHPDVVGMEC